ncbi:MAG: hypothetical protein D3910_20185, partial [Candidatus Electrothrix sp. ATG2]|nr:hypothetical protein [Candidatus Electrothrix sp. ATG2]
RITYNHPAAESIINFLCADLEVAPNITSAAEQSVVPRATCELNVGEDEHFTLQGNGESLYQGRCQRELAYALINEIIFHCLDKNDVGLALHAAAVQVAKGGILLPGNSGAGKSTFVAWLVACGCGYLTDELVVLSEESNRIRPFTRPLTIRSASAEALAPYIQFKQSEVLNGDSGFMIPHRQLNPDFSPAQPRLSLILFPHFKADAPPTLTELTPGIGCLRLLECFVNARNIPGHGINELARLTRNVPILELTYGSFTGLDALLAKTLPDFFQDIFS